ncbi:MAG: branched-chain amino acid ABC transporter permease [Oricola sp.]|nr:MAG: branched-chain amino acid ABC transporter permease [Oricola sp.]
MAMSETSHTPLPHAAPRGFLAAAASQHGGLITAFLLMALIVPFLGSYWIKNFTSMIAVAIAAQGVALLHARLGFVSLAGIAMMGVGGWFGLRLAHATGLPFEIVLVLAALCTGAAGVLLGLPALKHRGLIYALITLMFAAGFHVVVSSIGFPDGGSGFWGRIDGSAERQLMARPAIAASDLAYFLYALAIAAAAFTATHIVTKSAVGRAWAMIRAGDAVAHAAGVRIGIARAKAFGLAGALAGVGGCLLAGSIGQLDGRSFDPVQSLLLYGLVIIAGPWSLAAALIAGFLYRVFPAILDSWGVDGDIAITIFGLALIHAIVSAPRGIAGQLHDLTSAIQNRFSGVDR